MTTLSLNGPRIATGRIHRVRVDGFWMDTTDPTNADFARFVDATGHVTCSRYIVGTRGKGEVSSGANHPGFRCVKEAATRS
jgi:formylglycine-generating enzyme required for sulfatase activity